MREILFRGKRIDNGEWVCGYLFASDTDNSTFIVCGSWNVKIEFEVDSATIGQYTGLTDKNGTKIFDGDIVLVNWFGRSGKFVVGYEGGSFFPYQIGCKFNFNSLWDVWFQNEDGTIMEVIGNTHDNPDLLTCRDNC